MTGTYILIDNMKETKNTLSERERERENKVEPADGERDTKL